MSHTKTWTDWADDNPEQAEADLRERQWAEHKRLAAQAIPDRDGADSAAMYAAERTSCEHEDVAGGWCQNCGDAIEDWEPTDAEIFAHYGQTMEPRAAA